MGSIYINSLKKILDFIASFVLVIILSPVIIAISLLVKLTSKGPIFFRQERIGKNSVPFMIYKFRSMRCEAPSVSSSTMNNDEYVTKIGKFIRRTSLDELPQLFNILKGEMSFVGPRPFIPNEGIIIQLRKENKVDRIKPGLTGWAQVVDRETDDQYLKYKLDLYYLENQGFKLDFKILVLTLFSLRGR